MSCDGAGQDMTAAVFALTTAFSRQITSADELNLYGNLLMLAGQQLCALAAARAVCEDKRKPASESQQ